MTCMPTTSARMAYFHVLHKASEKAAEVVGVFVEILMRLGTKICGRFLILHPIPATHVGNRVLVFAANRLFTRLSTGHPVPSAWLLGHVSRYV